jgi:hypothetical protein
MFIKLLDGVVRQVVDEKRGRRAFGFHGALPVATQSQPSWYGSESMNRGCTNISSEYWS